MLWTSDTFSLSNTYYVAASEVSRLPLKSNWWQGISHPCQNAFRSSSATRPVQAVPMESVAAVREFLGRVVRSMVDLELVTGMRPVSPPRVSIDRYLLRTMQPPAGSKSRNSQRSRSPTAPATRSTVHGLLRHMCSVKNMSGQKDNSGQKRKLWMRKNQRSPRKFGSRFQRMAEG